jgi:hypothetical protein
LACIAISSLTNLSIQNRFAMAQGVIAGLPVNGTALDPSHKLHEIEELEKIVRFRDAVLAGLHPRFKVPANVVGRQSSASRNGSSPNSLPSRSNFTSQQHATISTTPDMYANESASHMTRSPNLQRSSTGKFAGPIPTIAKVAKSEINPILLEKSDDLIKAEIQLQRQRLERVLREQVELRRTSQKAALQTSESLPDFDLSEVLFKALTIVHPSATTEAEPSVGARTSASDSFDENTFYSSQHDTPEQRKASLESKEPFESHIQNAISADTHPVNAFPKRDNVEMRDLTLTGITDVDSDVQEVERIDYTLSQPQTMKFSNASKIPGLNTESSGQSQLQAASLGGKEVIDISNGESRRTSVNKLNTQSEAVSGISSVDSHGHADRITVQTTTSQLLGHAFPVSPSPPRVYGHDLSPFAPQPARVSPLVTHKPPPILQQSILLDEPAPSQVTTLRNQAAVSSPESSPKGSKASERKKGKKKKSRKSAGKQSIVDAPDTPYIKTEPKSPSPLTSAPLPRPHKRQRQTFQQGAELNYDEPRYETPREDPLPVVQPRYQERRAESNYIRSDEERRYDPREAEVSYRRAPREEPQYRRVVSHDVRATPQPQSMYVPVHYSPSQSRPARAVSQTVMERPIQELPRYYREEPLSLKTGMRVDMDRDRSRSPILYDRRSPAIMAPPPRLAPRRIVVDEYGRQFYEPAPRPASLRQSVAPLTRPGDDEALFERGPIRAIPRAVAETFEEDGVIYRRASPLPLPRRVLTQPEYQQDYRAYRQREYSTRPTAIAPSGEEYVRVADSIARRQMSHFEEPPREFITRVASVRPEAARYEEAPREYAPRVASVRPEVVRYEDPTRDYMTRVASVRPEAMRYEAVPQFAGRMQSVRPEAAGRDYVSSVRQEAHREMHPQAIREFSVRPVEVELGGREYIPQQAGFAPPRQVIRRIVDDVEYIERPREARREIYADEGPGEVMYR